MRALVLGAQIGISIAASLGLAIGGGYLLDQWLNTRPVFLLLGVLVGIIASGYTVIELARQFEDGDRPDGGR